MADTLIGNVEAFAKSDKAGYLVDGLEALGSLAARILEELAGGETAPEIAAPYLASAGKIVVTYFESLASSTSQADRLAAFDSAAASLLSEIKFGKDVTK